MAAGVFFEDVEDLVHDNGLGLLGFSGHGEEDGAEGKGPVLDIFYGAEEALDFGGGGLLVEAGVDEANHGARGFWLVPIAGQR